MTISQMIVNADGDLFGEDGMTKYLSAESVHRLMEQAQIAAFARAAEVAKKEVESWDGRNADRYWQSKRIAGEIETLKPE